LTALNSDAEGGLRAALFFLHIVRSSGRLICYAGLIGGLEQLRLTTRTTTNQDRPMKASALAAVAFALAIASPALALTAKEKMETCKFGAADQQLTGKKEQDFIKKCMANEPAAKSASKTPAPAKK
jgi:hypothetical protein